MSQPLPPGWLPLDNFFRISVAQGGTAVASDETQPNPTLNLKDATAVFNDATNSVDVTVLGTHPVALGHGGTVTVGTSQYRMIQLTDSGLTNNCTVILPSSPSTEYSIDTTGVTFGIYEVVLTCSGSPTATVTISTQTMIKVGVAANGTGVYHL